MNRLNETEIRQLLDRYYTGETSRDEEQAMAAWFAGAKDLPDDLRTEGMMFQAMTEASESEVDLPAEYNARINDALEKEMARERRLSGRRNIQRKVWAIGGSAAACLLAGWIGYGVLSDDVRMNKTHTYIAKSRTESISKKFVRSEAVADADRPSVNAESGQSPESGSINKRKESVRISRGTTPANANLVAADMTGPSTKHNETVSNVVTDEDYDYTDYERELLADNYYVVNNADEASAIVSSVFSRLDSKVTETKFCVSDAQNSYSMEMDEIYF